MSDQQLPPADRLAEVRQQLRSLTEQEAALKALVINDPSARTGNQFCVDVVEVASNRTDIKELRACHPDLVAEFTFQVKTTRVELRGISEDGEIISLRKKAAS
jgi:hypothetical protein